MNKIEKLIEEIENTENVRVINKRAVEIWAGNNLYEIKLSYKPNYQPDNQLSLFPEMTKTLYRFDINE